MGVSLFESTLFGWFYMKTTICWGQMWKIPCCLNMSLHLLRCSFWQGPSLGRAYDKPDNQIQPNKGYVSIARTWFAPMKPLHAYATIRNREMEYIYIYIYTTIITRDTFRARDTQYIHKTNIIGQFYLYATYTSNHHHLRRISLFRAENYITLCIKTGINCGRVFRFFV